MAPPTTPQDSIAPVEESQPYYYRTLSDSANSLLKGSIGIGEGGIGLVDTAMALNPANLGRRAARSAARYAGFDVPEEPEPSLSGGLEQGIGYRPREARRFLDEFDSPELKAAKADVAKADGFIPTVVASVKNPSTVIQSAIESAPSMLAGAGVARGLLGLASGLSPVVAGAIGEGAVSAGQSASQTRRDTGTLTPTQAATAVSSGAVTGVISRLAGRVADALKIPGADPDVLMAGGRAAEEALVKRVAGGFIREGMIEELPQSAQEQVQANIASGRPWDEGVAQAAATGLLIGGVMGAGGNLRGGAATERRPSDLAEDEFTQTAAPSTPEPPSPGPEPVHSLGDEPFGAPIAPARRPGPAFDPTSAQIVLEAEILGGDGLKALMDTGMSKARAESELKRVRAVLGPKAPAAKGVDRAEDKKAERRRAEVEAAGRPSPADEIASFDADPLANAPRRREATPEEVAAYLEDAQRGIMTAEEEAAQTARLRAERDRRGNEVVDETYAPLLEANREARTAAERAFDDQTMRPAMEEARAARGAREEIASRGGPAFRLPPLMAAAVAADSIKPLVDAGVPGSPSQLRKMLEKAKASAQEGEAFRSGEEIPANVPNSRADLGSIGADQNFGHFGAPVPAGERTPVAEEARGIAERVNPVGRAEETFPAGDAGPQVERPARVVAEDGGDSGEVHGESVRLLYDEIAARVEEIKRAEPNLPHRVIAQRVNQEFGTDNRLGRSREALGRRIVDAVLKGQENPKTTDRGNYPGGPVSAMLNSRKDTGPENDPERALYEAMDRQDRQQQHIAESVAAKVQKDAANLAEQEALRQRLEESVRNTRREGVEGQPAVAAADDSAIPEDLVAVGRADRTGLAGQTLGGGVEEKRSASGRNTIVADEAPKAVEAHAESVPRKSVASYKAEAKADAKKQGPLFARKPSAEDMSFARPQPAGFFSQLERAAEVVKQPMKGTDMLRFLSTRDGVKAAEMKWTGLDDFLRKKGDAKVAPEEVREFLKANRVTVTEVIKKANYDSKTSEEWQAESDRLMERAQRAQAAGRAAEANRLFDESDAASRHAQGIDEETGGTAGMPKFFQWQIPGGTNYREVLLTLPDTGTNERLAQRWFKKSFPSLSVSERQFVEREAKTEPPKGEFRSSHFDEPNILAHVRLNDRTVNGKKVLFVEEIQSDWAQKGRKQGFNRPAKWDEENGVQYLDLSNGEDENFYSLKKTEDGWRLTRSGTGAIEYFDTESAAKASAERGFAGGPSGAVPSAPFVEKTEDWTALALKTILHKAATEGYDSVAWTTGTMQNERYKLSKQIEAVTAAKTAVPDQWRISVTEKNGAKQAHFLKTDELEGFIGKDLAQKIIEDGGGEYRGLALDVGGDGMKAFYDKIVPQVAEKIGRKFGAKVGTVQIQTGGKTYQYVDPATGEVSRVAGSQRRLKSDGMTEVQSIPITPEMRVSVTSEGFPLFQRSRETTEADWEHYNGRSDTERGKTTREAYKNGAQVVGAPAGVRVVDFEGDVEKSVLGEMARASAALAARIAPAVRMLQAHVPMLKFGGFSPAGNLHGVQVSGMVFVNQLATHQIAVTAAKEQGITYHEAFARAMTDVLIHEAAHYAERGHGDAFLAEIERIREALGPVALRAIRRDLMKYASDNKNRTQNARMYEKALPGWREGERRGREAAAAVQRGDVRGRPDVPERLYPRPRSDTGDAEGAGVEGDGSQGGLLAPDGNAAEGLGTPAFIRGTDGGVAFSRKPPAPPETPTPTPEELKDPTFWEKVTEWRKGAMLSSIRNLAQNAVGNVVSLAGGMAEIPFAAAADRTLNPEQRQVYMGELAVSLAAFKQHGPEALSRFKQGMKDAMSGVDRLDKDEAQKFERHRNAIGGGKNSGAIEKKIGTAIRTSFRIMGVTDEFFKDMAYQQALYREAYRQARNSGLQGAAAASRVDKTMDDYRQAMGPDREAAKAAHGKGVGSGNQRAMHSRADYAAKYRTFTLPADYENAGAFGWVAKNAADFEKTVPVLGPALGLAVPFKITPAHVAFQAYERTPFAAFSVVSKFSELRDLAQKLKQSPDEETTAALTAQLNKKTEEAVNTLARAAMGSVLGAAGFALAAAGLLTGSGPPDPDDRRVWQDAGHIPNAIRIGDSWYAFDRLDPVLNVLALAANLTQASKEKDANKLMGAFMNALQETFVNNTFLDGFQRFSDMLKDPTRYGKTWLQNTEGSFVPSMVRQTAEVIDPTVRNRKGIIAPIVSGIPGLSKSLPPVRTGTGEPAKRTQRLGESVLGPLSPFGFMRTGDANGDPLAKEFLAADYAPDPHRDFISVGVGPVGLKTQHRVDLTEKELEIFRRADEAATKQLREAINSAGWGRLNADQKKAYFQRVYSAMSAQAKKAVMPSVIARLRSKLIGKK